MQAQVLIGVSPIKNAWISKLRTPEACKIDGLNRSYNPETVAYSTVEEFERGNHAGPLTISRDGVHVINLSANITTAKK